MRYIVLITILCLTVSMTLWSGMESGPAKYHSSQEIDWFGKMLNNSDSTYLQGQNALFTAAGECTSCHGSDINGIANVDADGNDINVADDWRATMMAMSAKDPFWKAKVSHESLVNPDIVNELESSCTDCHAPLGYFNAIHLGEAHYTMADLALDSTGLDGVSCGACHQISPDGVGETFSGQDIVYVEDTIYGQYEDPFGPPMTSFVGFSPIYSEHMNNSEVCASCHTLITETVGLDGQFNGNEFVEQATYHEWVNSSYNSNGKSAVQCQGCHMERVDDPVVITSNPINIPPRSPFYRHDIVGGNTFMLKLMKTNRDTLDIRAFASHFDTIIDHTTRMLQENTLDLEIEELDRTADLLTVDLELRNKAGHKFPSGYPSRISFVRLVATDASGDTLFASGLLADDYEIIDRDIPYEPHYDLIEAEDQVQIYELVLGDEAGEETTVLSRAETGLKDNRLVPFGFTSTHFAYDTTQLYGQVLLDDDFNVMEGGFEGTGMDNVTYAIPVPEDIGQVNVVAQVYYQVVPPRWLDEMFDFQSTDIDHFAEMYADADKEPVLVGEVSLVSGINSVSEIYQPQLLVYPNPTRTGKVTIDNLENRALDKIEVFDANGHLVYSTGAVRSNTLYVELPETKGIYYFRVYSNGVETVERVLRL